MVRRYHFDMVLGTKHSWPEEMKKGDYVAFCDYQELAAENARLREEVERLELIEMANRTALNVLRKREKLFDTQAAQIAKYEVVLKTIQGGWGACGDEYAHHGLGLYEYINAILLPADYPEYVAALEQREEG